MDYVIALCLFLMQKKCHFRVPKTVAFKTWLSAKPLFLKWVLFAWKWKMIFIPMAFHLTSLWKRGFGELGNGLFLLILIVYLKSKPSEMGTSQWSLVAERESCLPIFTLHDRWCIIVLTLHDLYNTIQTLMTPPKESLSVTVIVNLQDSKSKR